MNEATLEQHICDHLQNSGWLKHELHDTHSYINWESLEQFLQKSVPWQDFVSKSGSIAAKAQMLASIEKQPGSSLQFFQKGVTIEPDGIHIPLLDVEDWTKNQFTFVRQVQHSSDNRKLKGDIALWINGLPFGFIEVKNRQTGQTAQNGVAQIVDRVKSREAPKLFERIIFSMTLDAESAWLSVDATSTKNFRPFNPCKNFYNAPKDDFYTAYLYSGKTSFLHPKNVTELLATVLYIEPVKGELIFPRYHQWEAARLIKQQCTDAYAATGTLGERLLIQHSPGSGKSKTIAWAARFLVTLKIADSQRSLFDKILIVTDRRNLDRQIQRDLAPTIGEGQVVQAQSTKHLGELLGKSAIPVITSTVQKFLELGELQFSTNERVCLIIDEAHRSQDGELNEKMRKTVEAGFNTSGYEESEESLFALDKMTEKKSNTVTVAFTATPSSMTLRRFGKDGQPHHLYSMRQAIEEGYILNPLKNVITYDTLYQLHQTGMWHLTLKEFPTALLNRQLTLAAYEDPAIIEAKSSIITAIIRERTSLAIRGKGKAMLVCSSKKSARLYQEALRAKLSEFDIKPLIAFTGTVTNGIGEDKTETQMNAATGATQGIEATFENELAYRILVVVNKFQTGFDEPLLHTLFIDKTISGINAVQTITRVNRCMDGKDDTLVVDFTNSYSEIAKAFEMFIDLPPTFAQKIVTPADLDTKFRTILQLSSTEPAEWEIDLNPDTLEGMAELETRCLNLATKIKALADDSILGHIQGLLNDLMYLSNKGLLTRYKEWQWRKLVLKGVSGHLHGAQVKFSVEEIRESVATVSMVVSLERIREGEVFLATGGGGNGGGGVITQGLSLAAAIHRLNQQNFEKLALQLQRIAQQKTALLAGEKTRVLEQLSQFCAENQEALLAYATFDATSPTAGAAALLNTAAALRYDLDTNKNSDPIILEWLLLEIKELRFRKLESAFYACHAGLKSANETAMLEATRIEGKLHKLTVD